MFKRILVRIAILTALPFLLTASPAAAADDYDEQRKVESGSCVQARGWGSAGSFSRAIANDSVVWRGSKHLHIYHSWGAAELRTCDRGYLEDGGTVGLRHTWTVEGTRLGSCDIGWGGSCNVSDYAETSTRATPWRSNTDGSTSYNFGADDVYAASTDTGYLSAYTHKVYVRFISPSGNAETNTNATVRMRRGD